ncbi:MAG: primosomal protein N' [Candidatus Omnitrophica bacterium]|nr:primosomal protein N' [Candidatus Omnitrophota bacterium]
MLFAKVVVGLPVSGPFDYIVPDNCAEQIKIGSRVWVSFGTRRIVGYVTDLVKKSEIKRLKPILELIDKVPLLSKEMLLITKELSEYYCCSWGEAIEVAIPDDLRKGKKIISGDSSINGVRINSDPIYLDKKVSLIHDLDGRARWGVYINEIKQILKNNQSAIVLLPDVHDIAKVSSMINKELGIEVQPLYRKQPKELDAWLKVKSGGAQVIAGTRSAIFAPLNNLGLIIIDDEASSVYKQDQVPHYHAREAGFLRAKIEGAKLILGSRVPSLESYYSSKKDKAKYTLVPRKSRFPDVKLIDTRHLAFVDRKKKQVVARILEDAIYVVLNTKGKVLLFLNRKGFATQAACHACGKVLKCPRCNINLVYHYKGNLLSCHYCNYKIEPPKICPECNAGYIKFSGGGTEKMESELSRIFPQARIKIWDEACQDISDADIFIATSSVIRRADLNFDLIGVLGIDNTLNRVDFRATEKVFELLAGLLVLTDKNILIQTSSPTHHCFQALFKKDESYFYEAELKQRKQLNFPPFSHLILVKLRGKSEEKVKVAAEALFNKLTKENKSKELGIVAVTPTNPPKLRGNFYWQVLLRTGKVALAGEFIRKGLKGFRHSGIIVTIDVDPV